jgi:catechol 2,3-dioxygenase-like lactoylglutathione lyase family enzyme
VPRTGLRLNGAQRRPPSSNFDRAALACLCSPEQRERMTIIDHLGFGVSDYDRAKAFYVAALGALGITLVTEVGPEETQGKGRACGFGKGGKPEFWIGSEGRTTPALHVAFLVDSRAAVRAFYEAALRAGGRDNGAPGLRPHYHSDYYGAFVLDLDDHNVEAVCHTAE